MFPMSPSMVRATVFSDGGPWDQILPRSNWCQFVILMLMLEMNDQDHNPSPLPPQVKHPR